MPRSHPHSGRHELGQNFLVDTAVVDRIVALAADRPGPLVEWGAGNGAITLALGRLGRPLVGVEIDPRLVRELRRKVEPHVCITEGDILRHAPPAGAVVVGNIPFHLTTPALRHLLGSPAWSRAVLVTQWEVARKRSGVGGATQLTAQWWPWYDVALDRRIPASAFSPRPTVDAGLLCLDRRGQPLLPSGARVDYQAWVARVFGGRGRGLLDILRRADVPPDAAAAVVRRDHGRPATLPRDLRPEEWAALFRARVRRPDARRTSRGG